MYVLCNECTDAHTARARAGCSFGLVAVVMNVYEWMDAHDTRVILQAADQALMRDGMPPSRENMERLDTELRRIVSQQRTTLQDDQKRQNLLRRFSQMLQKKFPGVSLTPFGSFVSVFHTAGSDIDVRLKWTLRQCGTTRRKWDDRTR